MLRRELPNGYALRLLEESDADELFALIDANREHLGPWMPWVAARARARRRAALHPRHAQADRRQRRAADRDRRPRRADRGDGRRPQHRLAEPQDEHRLLAGATSRGGTMTEAVRAYVDHAFTTWKLNRVMIQAAVENARSRAIPERLGSARRGPARGRARRGRMLDGVVYAMLAADWPGADGIPTPHAAEGRTCGRCEPARRLRRRERGRILAGAIGAGERVAGRRRRPRCSTSPWPYVLAAVRLAGRRLLLAGAAPARLRRALRARPPPHGGATVGGSPSVMTIPRRAA